jgi:glyoxylase-like metal-dependent hydrolase (beta-lactamase superfamily II)
MSIDFRSSEADPTSGGANPSQTSSDLRTPFQSFKNRRSRAQIRRSGLQPVPKRGPFYDVAPDILGLKTGIVNTYFIGAPGSSQWVLIDAGMAGGAQKIINTARRRFGASTPPSAIILTHGHFDHVGSLHTLLREWDVPVYAHSLEMPYLTGRSSYPPPDPSVGNGCMALLSSLYPSKPIDLGSHVRILPPEGVIMQLPGWRWLHTPGHTPGHVSLFREDDHVLIAGDAFVTLRAESLLANLTLEPELHGPPMYFTPDWIAARKSVAQLAGLRPEVVATGHGIPLYGQMMQHDLERLAARFEQLAVPDHGRYRLESALADHTGVIRVPPSIPQPEKSAALIAGGVLVGVVLGLLMGRKPEPKWRDIWD